MMKRFLAALIISLLLLPPAARADGPDDQYVSIYGLIQLGDTMVERGQTAAALARYNEAQAALNRLQAANPNWNVNLVHFRQKYLATKISQLSRPVVAPVPAPIVPKPTAENPTTVPATSAVTNIPETVVTPVVPVAPNPSAEVANQLRQLQEQVKSMQADKSLLEAKLKEALAARPAAIDPQEFSKAQEEIKDLQKQNALLQTSLADAKANPAAISSSRQEKMQQSLADANRRVTQLTEANAALVADQAALQARVKANAAPDATTLALRDENALLKKQVSDLKTRGATASSDEALKLKLRESEAQVAALQSDKQILQLEKIALQTRVSQSMAVTAAPVPVVAPATLVAPASVIAPVPAPVTSVAPSRTASTVAPVDLTTPPALDSVTASRIAQLEAQRDELQKSLNVATHDIAGRKKGKEMASRIDDMTRQLAALRARIEIYEAHPVPYTPDELAMMGKPDTTLLMASAHNSGKKTPKELPASAAVLLAEARRYFVAHELDKAEQKYLEVLKLDEKNVNTLADLASIQLEEGHAADSEKNLKTALALEPNDDYTMYVLGQLKFQQRSYDEAFNYLSRASELNPQNPKILNVLGLTLSSKGQRGPAETAFRKAIQLDPGFADAHLNLAVVYATQQPPLYELARWHYQKALATGHAPSPKVEALLDPSKSAAARP